MNEKSQMNNYRFRQLVKSDLLIKLHKRLNRYYATRLPSNLKASLEWLSGFCLDDVRVVYNSPKPAQYKALAYAYGTEIHIAPGQEFCLPHEAWHVVQQKQGRVTVTQFLQNTLPINAASAGFRP
jgi:hypothetical protein